MYLDRLEVMGKLPKHYDIKYYSQNGGLVTSKQDTRIDTLPFSRISHGEYCSFPEVWVQGHS